jgi:signal transduction histidine kinase
MELHKLIKRQLKKHLGDFAWEENDALRQFVKAISQTYENFEKDAEFSEHAFSVADTEYHKITQKLIGEKKLRDESISALLTTLSTLNPNKKFEETGLLEIATEIQEATLLRNKAEKEAIEARNIAEEANKAKSEFLANMSHEIRTPLNAVIGFSDLLLQSNLNETQFQYLATISKSANSLLDIVNDVLDLSKIESGKLDLDIEPCNIEAICIQAVDLIQYQAKQKNIVLSFTIAPDVPKFILADEIRIRQVLLNLLSNALKFTKEGSVSLAVATNKPLINDRIELKISIKDTGIGIAKQNHQKILEAFTQEDASTTKKFGGTGLGLSITNQLLQLMGSKIQLKSDINQGAEFFFYVNFEVPQINIPNHQQLVAEPQHNGTNDFKPVYYKGMKILVVEDNTINMLLTKTMLRQIIPDVEIIEATNGVDALVQYKASNPALVLMDIQMPEMNGYDTTAAIRNIEGETNVPIIALTAGTLRGEKERCFQAGMNDYITKPFTKKVLEGALQSCLAIG